MKGMMNGLRLAMVKERGRADPQSNIDALIKKL
jgi:hypothetical protein